MLNSGYGALASKYFLYYLVDNAEAITLSGQYVNKFTGNGINNLMKDLFVKDKNYWVAGDTDSFYLTLESFMDTVKEQDIQKRVDIADQFGNEVVQPKIDELCNNIKEYINGYAQRMVWEREVIASDAIWVAKKKYAMNIWDEEGVRFTKEPKLKLTGLESVKSSTPQWSKELLEKCYKLSLDNKQDEMYDLVEQVEEDFFEYDLNDIAMPKGVNNIMKYYDDDNVFKSGTPRHVRASIVHNQMLEKLNIKSIPPITDGNKIKFVELKLPNPTTQPVIAFDTFLPSEFGLNEYVDYDKILRASFKKPLQIFLDSIGWENERTNTLF